MNHSASVTGAGARWLRLLALAGLTFWVAGCAAWRDRVGEQGESRIVQAEWTDAFVAVREEVEERDFRVRHAREEAGRLTALSPLWSESSFRSARQTELEFFLEEGKPGEVEIRLLIREIEERETASGPSASRRTVRGSPLYQALLDGIEERLKEGSSAEADGAQRSGRD